MKTIEIDGLPYEELDLTPPYPTRLQLLEQHDESLRIRAMKLPSQAFWRVVGHPGVLFLLDKMTNTDDKRGAFFTEIFEEMVQALEYALQHEEKRVSRRGRT